MDTSNSILIKALQDPAIFPHPVESFSVIETHISWVLLTGQFAYKFKKPVNFGFLDFSTLDKRRFFCEEELRLNKRLAPELYLEIVNITGSPDKPVLNGEGHTIEYAVKMVQFPQSAQLDHVLSEGLLTNSHVDLIAKEVANFHAGCQVAHREAHFGSTDAVRSPVVENFAQIRQQAVDQEDLDIVEEIERWSDASFSRHQADFQKRKADGFIRECHGDMHLRNIALINEQIVIFDCLEFNEEFRWIDVMSEIAFLCMDLDDRNKEQFSNRLLNAYLEITGDYEGVILLRFYQVYRAMVRAKVDALRLSQAGLSEDDKVDIGVDFRTYLHLAGKYTQQEKPVLFITHGLSGSGKTTGTQNLIEATGLIRIRSDIERKRLYSVAVTSREEETGKGIYSREASIKTYERLRKLAESLLLAGRSVIVDATFLKQHEREKFMALAEKVNVPFHILSFRAPESVLQTRVIERQAKNQDASDASVAVLESQLKNNDPLSVRETEFSTVIDNKPIDIDDIKHLWPA